MTKQKLYRVLALVAIISCVAELAGVHMHSASWWPLPFGYDLCFGFVGCWLLIIIAKMIMAPLLQRDEHYYEDGGKDHG